MSLTDLPERGDKNFQQKCIYLLNMIKVKDKEIYKKLKYEFENEVTVDETVEFYKKIQAELKK